MTWTNLSFWMNTINWNGSICQWFWISLKIWNCFILQLKLSHRQLEFWNNWRQIENLLIFEWNKKKQLNLMKNWNQLKTLKIEYFYGSWKYFEIYGLFKDSWDGDEITRIALSRKNFGIKQVCQKVQRKQKLPLFQGIVDNFELVVVPPCAGGQELVTRWLLKTSSE